MKWISKKNIIILSTALLVVFSIFFLVYIFKKPFKEDEQFRISSEINHASIIRNLDSSTLDKGRLIYNETCISCHGSDGEPSYPQARSFNKDKFRFGNRPHEMWNTITNGAGLMAAQTWLSPVERYYVIQYIREHFVKRSNPKEYFEITNNYLARFPKPEKIDNEKSFVQAEALKGMQKYGQEYFQNIDGDYGRAIYGSLKDHAVAGLTVKLDNDINLNYNVQRMSTTAIWKGGINTSETKYKIYWGQGQPFVEGEKIDGLDVWQWTFGDKIEQLNKTTSVRSPLPSRHMRYLGHYTYKKNTILSYTIEGRDVLELPKAIKLNDQIILSQTLTISGGTQQKINIGKLTDGVARNYDGELTTLIDAKTKKFIAAKIISENKDIKCEVNKLNMMVLTIPASKHPVVLQVLRATGNTQEQLLSFVEYAKEQSITSLPRLEELIKGGPAQWPHKIKVKGDLNVGRPHYDPIFARDEDKRTNPDKLVEIPKDYPYTVDNITLPFNNPYSSWIRPASLGFKSDGSLVVGTYTGDVWLAKGIDKSLEEISWQRIATGQGECMGLKVVNDNIYVTTHQGITRLHDLNGDGEIDFYENFFSDPDVSAFYHSFNFGLETDSKGNFYYTKTGEFTDNKDPGNVIKVSPDGKRWESIATGFRVPNGITISPNDEIYVSDNQGDWIPASKINLIKKGGFYGYVPNIAEKDWSPDGKKFSEDQLVNKKMIRPEIVPVPDTFHQPAIWIPQEFDNSSGGGAWSDRSWGPLGNRFIHTSYGTGWIYYFLPQGVDGVTSGALLALPFQLDAGIQRAAINPVDKDVYTVGLTGWDDPEASRYGVLCRVRYKGGQGHLLTGTKVVKDGIQLSFNSKLDNNDIQKKSNYDIIAYNYKWTSNYGSKHYSVKNPGTVGEDNWTIKNIILSEDGRSIVLDIPEISPANTVRVRFNIKSIDGARIKNSVYLTINKFPNWRSIIP